MPQLSRTPPPSSSRRPLRTGDLILDRQRSEIAVEDRRAAAAYERYARQAEFHGFGRNAARFRQMAAARRARATILEAS